MSATASDSNSYQPADTKGLDDLFDDPGMPAQASTSQADTPAQPSADNGISVEEAAQIHGVSPRTIIRRLQKGTLTGFKIPGQFGLEWRVSTSAQVSTNQPDTPAQLSASQSDASAQPSTSQASESVIAELRQQIEDLKVEMDEKLAEAQKLLQGASYRNGYLEAQLESERQQIKLLTDSQHKQGWWAGFCSWFMGQKA